MIVGIDLGTTNSAVAYMSVDGPRLIPNSLGELLTPSIVGIDSDDRILIGRAALELQIVHPRRCASVFKRQMGTDWTINLVGRDFSAQQLSAFVLRALKEDAEAQLKCVIERAVISVPAYFSEPQRRATVLAGEMAGLKVDHILNEPTAAALAYGFHEIEREQLIAVLDLGGGTFDVSIVDKFEGVMEVRASAGELFLGGEDFTQALAGRVLEQTGRNFERMEIESPQLVSRLMQNCEMAKRALSRQDVVDIQVPHASGEVDENSAVVKVGREQFMGWTDSILSRIDLPIRRCLADAGLQIGEVAEVLVAGGASRMPAFLERAAKLFKKTPQVRINPDEVVALGAGVQAGLVERHASVRDIVVTDVVPFTLGIAICKQIGYQYHDGYFLPVIHRNSSIPCSHAHIVQPITSNATQLGINIYQGESRRVQENTKLGSLEVKNIPPGPDQPVEVRFTYDLNGLLEVEATVQKTMEKSRLVIVRHVRGLQESEIAAAVERMQALKVVPRTQAVNRFLLKRAERVYRELPFQLRDHLEQLITLFEHALELQQPADIERLREALRQFLDAYESGEIGPELGDTSPEFS